MKVVDYFHGVDYFHLQSRVEIIKEVNVYRKQRGISLAGAMKKKSRMENHSSNERLQRFAQIHFSFCHKIRKHGIISTYIPCSFLPLCFLLPVPLMPPSVETLVWPQLDPAKRSLQI
jgi:hypothetical protein